MTRTFSGLWDTLLSRVCLVHIDSFERATAPEDDRYADQSGSVGGLVPGDA